MSGASRISLEAGLLFGTPLYVKHLTLARFWDRRTTPFDKEKRREV